ncbi:exported hypothetical protein [Gammaproteobacteria bacterium]
MKNITFITTFSISLFLSFPPIVTAESPTGIFNPSNNHTYTFFNTPLDWGSAQSACGQLGGYLATITSQEENDWITTNIIAAVNSSVWVGGTDEGHEGTWTWVTGEIWDYKNWNPGEPNNLGGNENYLEIASARLPNGIWNDGQGYYSLPYLCESDSLNQIYSNDFSAGADSRWSDPRTATANGESFLGASAYGFGAGSNTLTLTNLPPHTSVTVTFDLYLIQSWDGNGQDGGGPDNWQLTADGNTLLLTNFANWVGSNTQAYPNQLPPYGPGGSFLPRTRAFENGHLGFGTGSSGDSTYRLTYTFAHTAATLALTFTGQENQSPGDEGWGLDNVRVSIPNHKLIITKSGTGNGTVTSAPAGINCGVDCSEDFAPGAKVTLTAKAATGSTFAGWSGVDNCPGTGTCTVTMNAGATVTATFHPIIYSLIVLKTGAGTVTSNPAGISCGSDCNENFSPGAPAFTLTATPATGSIFAGWNGGGCSGTGTCVVTTTSSKTIKAPFKSTDFIITAVTLNPAAGLSANSAFSAVVTIKNQGTIAGDGGQLTVWADKTAVPACGTSGGQSAAVGALAAGASKTLTITGLTPGTRGIKSLRAFVDSSCAITESSETNNQFTKQYRVMDFPDFVVTNVMLNPVSPTHNGTFKATVTVKNQGSLSAEAGFLDVWTNQPTTQGCGALGNKYLDIGILAAGAAKTVTVSLPAGVAGEKTLRIFVDSWCETSESGNEGNNQLVKTYTVQ